MQRVVLDLEVPQPDVAGPHLADAENPPDRPRCTSENDAEGDRLDDRHARLREFTCAEMSRIVAEDHREEQIAGSLTDVEWHDATVERTQRTQRESRFYRGVPGVLVLSAFQPC